MKLSLFICLFLSGNLLISQTVSFSKMEFDDIQKVGTINLMSLPDDYNADIQHLEAPPVSGDSYNAFLHGVKLKIAELYPANNQTKISKRGASEPPRMIHNFIGNPANPGIPLDTHLAVTDEGQIVSAINTHIAIFDQAGMLLKGTGLSVLASQLDVPSNLFDPRVYYDGEMDRGIMAFLGRQGQNEDPDTKIVVGFSASSDLTGDWNFYVLPGNPFMLPQWTDFPMIGINETDFILTINLILEDVSWELGFVETLIWQLDKDKGYAGEEMSMNMYSDILFNDTPIRNLCPVKSGDGFTSKNTYFLSNRNFSIENDSFFFVELTGGVNEPNAEVLVDMLQSNIAYGAPPNANQPFGGDLQTNDARVLEALYYNDEIHFVGNTRNLTNNLAGIYHGVVSNVSGDKELVLEHIIGDDFEIGYPGISLAGSPTSDEGLMINFGHASSDRFPGMSAMFYSYLNGYSEIIEVQAGNTSIDALGAVERWGDYAGSQRKHNDPELVWISGTVGFGANNLNIPWVAALATPEGALSTSEKRFDLNSKIYPNPLINIFHFEFTAPSPGQRASVKIYDELGRVVEVLKSGEYVSPGENRLSFNISLLQKGNYYVNLEFDNGQIITKQIIVQ